MNCQLTAAEARVITEDSKARIMEASIQEANEFVDKVLTIIATKANSGCYSTTYEKPAYYMQTYVQDILTKLGYIVDLNWDSNRIMVVWEVPVKAVRG